MFDDIEITVPLVLTVAGVAAFVGPLALWAAGQYKWVRWVALSLLLTTASFGQPGGEDRMTRERIGHPKMIGPLQAMKVNARLVTLAPLGLVVFLALSAVRPQAGVPPAQATYGGVLSYQLVLVVKMMTIGLLSSAVGYTAVFVGNYIIFCYGITAWVRTREDATWAIRAIAAAPAMTLALCAIQVPVNYAALFSHQMRFEGMTGNPQHAAMMFGIALPATVYLAQTGDLGRMRVFWWAVLGLEVLALILTGSRTGLLMLLVLCGIMFRRYLPVAVFTAVAVYLILGVDDSRGADQPLSYYTQRGNTREETWIRAIKGFMEEPLFGYQYFEGEMIFTENSWLAMAYSAGVAGLIPMVAAAVFTVRVLRRARAVPGSDHHVVRMATALLAVVLIASMFEAFLLGAIVFPIYALFTLFAVMNWLLARPRSDVKPLRAPPSHGIRSSGLGQGTAGPDSKLPGRAIRRPILD
ncbi:MAG: O-antigen ligase family protein [Fimbriiglobus sp.]